MYICPLLFLLVGLLALRSPRDAICTLIPRQPGENLIFAKGWKSACCATAVVGTSARNVEVRRQAAMVRARERERKNITRGGAAKGNTARPRVAAKSRESSFSLSCTGELTSDTIFRRLKKQVKSSPRRHWRWRKNSADYSLVNKILIVSLSLSLSRSLAHAFYARERRRRDSFTR